MLRADGAAGQHLKSARKIQKMYPLSTHINDGKSSYGGPDEGRGGSRDVIGYANKPPVVRWPRGAKVAVNLVLNYEEGGENCLLHGDGESEKLLSEIVGAGALGTLYMFRFAHVTHVFPIIIPSPHNCFGY